MTDDDPGISGSTSPPGDDDSTLPSRPEMSARRDIGPYHLLERIGQGGMGEVYLAEQRTPIRRRVALKLIKAGMDTREVIARFESERQALAMMNHANVARIYDAGTTDTGRPYFVMEHVPGEPITDYCDRHKLDLRSRLELFIPVCQAIHHAHQKGIIHRDIKPTNVLVAIQDGRPVPKVIDFGVAKATQQTLTDQTLYTAQGKLVGTPAYMSPEQAEMTGLNIDTTSDVYSLGVLLYELLVGALPFDAKELIAAGIAEMHRIIREVEPPRPSTKISTLGERATEIAARRRAEPRAWRRQLHGELDWITMRAMEKDRTRRYSSASEFAADLMRYLDGDVVAAGPPTIAYRIRKSARRHRGFFLSLAAIIAALAVGLVIAVGYAQAFNRARHAAEWQAYVSGVRLAQSALEDEEPATARLALAGCPAHLRGWEWDYLTSRADQSTVTLLEFEDTAEHWRARIVRWIGSGDRVAVSTGDSLLHIVDTTPPYANRVLKIMPGRISALAVSTDGTELVVLASGDSTMHVIDCESGESRLRIPTFEHRFHGSLFYDSSTAEILHGDQHGLSRYDARTGAVRGRILDDGRRSIPYVSVLGRDVSFFSYWFPLDGGRSIAVCGPGPSDEPRVYDAATEELLEVSAGVVERSMMTTAVAAGNVIAYEGYARQDSALSEPGHAVAVYHRDTGESRIVARRVRPVRSLEVFGDSELLIGYDNGAIQLCSISRAEAVTTLLGHTARVHAMAAKPDGSQLVSIAGDGSLRLWDISKIIRPNNDLPWPYASGFTVDEQANAVSIHYGGVPYVWDIATGARIRHGREPLHSAGFRTSPVAWALHDGELSALECFSQVVAQPGGGGTQHSPGRHLRAIRIDAQGVASIGYESSPPDSAFLTASAFANDGSLFAISREQQQTRASSSRVRQPAPKPLRQWLKHNLEVREFLGGGLLASVDEDGPTITAMAFDDANRTLAVGTEAGGVYLLDLRSGKRRRLADRHAKYITDIEFSPDGRLVAAASADRTVTVWNPANGGVVSRMEGHDGGVGNICLDTGRDRLYSRSSDGSMRAWRLTTGDLLLTTREGQYDSMYRGISLADGGRSLVVARNYGALLIDSRQPFPRVFRYEPETRLELLAAEGRFASFRILRDRIRSFILRGAITTE